MKGDLVLRRSGVGTDHIVQTEAEEGFRRAIDIARRQQAKSWELRAVMSLAVSFTTRKEEEDRILATVTTVVDDLYNRN